MARRTFDVVDVIGILQHWYAGRSLSDTSAILGMDRKTLRKYIAPALVAWDRTGWASEEPGGLGRTGAGLVPGTGRCPAAARDLVGNR